MAELDRGTALRRIVLALSVLLAGLGLFWIARAFSIGGKLRFGNPPSVLPAAGDQPLDPEPRQVRAEITRVQGAAVVRQGDRCEFLIGHTVQNRKLYCVAQVVCGGKLLYGGPNRGYFPCKLLNDGDERDVVGADALTTKDDKDAAIQLNTREGVMRIWDDAQGRFGEFAVEAEVLSIL